MVPAFTPQFFHRNEDTKIAYHKIEGRSPGIIFLHGFRADMQGSKAQALADYAQMTGRAFLRFDYTCHGLSSGDIMEGTIGRWKDDVLSVLDTLTEGPQLLIGSSMGGWLGLLAALERPERIKAMIGIACAPDFVNLLVRPALTRQNLERLKTQGYFYLHEELYQDFFPITSTLLEESQSHHLLNEQIPLTIPFHFIQGMKDAEVPWLNAITLAEKVASEDTLVSLIKDGDHRLATPENITFLRESVDKMLSKIAL